MVRQEGGRWDIGAKDNSVYVERISENDEQVLLDVITPAEARALAELLTKYADKAEESDGKDSDDDSDKSDDDDSDDDEDDEDDDDSDDSDKSDKDSD